MLVERIAQQIEMSIGKAGVIVNGTCPWDIQVRSPDEFFRLIARSGMMGLGDSYVQGKWDCVDLREFFCRMFKGGLLEQVSGALPMKLLRLKELLTNPQNIRGALPDLCSHYGRGNTLFETMLDDRLTYTCGLWNDPFDFSDGESLGSAQKRKLDLICRKLGLESGMSLLDIGCGWGSLLGFASENYGVKASGVTPVPEQVKYVEERYPGVEVFCGDYRQIPREWCGHFDAVVSVGMFEHVGRKNYRKYMRVVDSLLKPDGISLLHCFGIPSSDVPLIDPWTERYIFPGLELQTLEKIVSTADGIHTVADVHEIGQHYDKTLVHWHRRFNDNWEQLQDEFGDSQGQFKRMWNYYLQVAAAAFCTRKLHLWQIVMQPCDSQRLYVSIR